MQSLNRIEILNKLIKWHESTSNSDYKFILLIFHEYFLLAIGVDTFRFPYKKKLIFAESIPKTLPSLVDDVSKKTVNFVLFNGNVDQIHFIHVLNVIDDFLQFDISLLMQDLLLIQKLDFAVFVNWQQFFLQ